MKKLVFAAAAAFAVVSVSNVFANSRAAVSTPSFGSADTDTVVTDTVAKPAPSEEKSLTICLTDTVDTAKVPAPETPSDSSIAE